MWLRYTFINELSFPVIILFTFATIFNLRNYYYIGGMPEAVDTYIDTRDLGQVRQVQLDTLRDYCTLFCYEIALMGVCSGIKLFLFCF